MLVLTRKKSQSIAIGDDIVLTVLHVRGGNVRIGIDAPVDVPIRRGELPEVNELPLVTGRVAT